MRFLRTFFILLLALVIGGSFLFFASREAFLFYTRLYLQGDIDIVESLHNNPARYLGECVKKFGQQSTNALAGFQLRFIDDKNYVVEAVCSFDTSQPVTINERALPMFVRKLPGSSGIFVPISAGATSSFKIGLFGRVTTFTVSSSSNEAENPSNTVYPVSVCTGWGYQCCSPDTEVPADTIITQGALDCPGRCAQRCMKRPVIYSFNAQPSFNSVTRSVMIQEGTQVQFGFVIGDADGTVQKAVLDFGDNTAPDVLLLGDKGSVAHDYACAAGQCTYTASLQLTDNENLQSNSNENSIITVRVTSK